MCLYPVKIMTRPKNGQSQPATVSCGHCLECLRQKSYEWAFRICDECRQYTDNAFITLTYNDDNLPSDHSVSRREVQLFMKLFRRAVAPLRVRFFACGEYGKERLRPHYHIIIFNWYPTDTFFWKKDGDVLLYRSPFLEKIWKKGFSSVGRVTFESALYCAKYMNKAQFIRDKNHFLPRVSLPFVQMSNRPGIGFNSAFRCDLQTDRIYNNGRSCKIPRYYLKVLEREGVYLGDFKSLRQAQGEFVERMSPPLLDRRKKFEQIFYERKFVQNNDTL